MKQLTHKDICPYYEDNCVEVGCVCPKYLAYEKVNQAGEIEKQLEKMNINYKEDKMNIMLNIQKHFSFRFFNIETMSEEEISSWIKQYDVCIHDEITEVHEHLDIYEEIYGKKKTNIEELKKELIDIWHFVMDMFLVGKIDFDSLFNSYLDLINENKEEKNKTLSFVFNFEKTKLKQNKSIIFDQEKLDSVSMMILLGYLMAGMRKVRQQINWKHWKKSKSKIDFTKLHSAFAVMFGSLIKCFIFVGLNCEDLYQIYVSKNIENVFRQDFGY